MDTDRRAHTPVGSVESDRRVAGKGWNLWRHLVGFSFVAAALGNLAFTAWNPDPLFDFLAADVELWVFDVLMEDLFAPNATLFVLVAVVFELTVGVMILSRGVWVELGLLGALGFQLFLMPYLMPFYPWAVGGVVTIAMVAPLLARSSRRPSGTDRRTQGESSPRPI